MADRPDARAGWIPEPEYESILDRVPVVCVDVLALDRNGRVGLILRKTPQGGPAWCLVGGAVRRGQTFAEAVEAQLRETLDGDFSYALSPPEPLTVCEYLPSPRPGALHDPRKHAVALVFAALLDGQPVARAEGSGDKEPEALDFRWHPPAELRGLRFGFGQDRVVAEALERLGRRA